MDPLNNTFDYFILCLVAAVLLLPVMYFLVKNTVSDLSELTKIYYTIFLSMLLSAASPVAIVICIFAYFIALFYLFVEYIPSKIEKYSSKTKKNTDSIKKKYNYYDNNL